MSSLNLDLAATEAAIVESESVPLLLDLWAPWCGPCLAMSPVLDRLSAETDAHLRIAKLDVEATAEANARFKVRGIPLLILFKGGKEVSRRTGVQTRDQLIAWMEHEGVDLGLSTDGELVHGGGMPVGGAFHGDPELRQFLLQRWGALADSGAVRTSRFPYWAEGHGTASAALVKSADAQTFESLTAMPESFGMVLDFVKPTARAHLERISAALPAGADVRAVPLRMLCLWLSDEQWRWQELLGADANQLRIEWVKAATALLRKEKVSEEEWSRLSGLATSFGSDDPRMVVQQHFGKVIHRLSPPPMANDTLWGGLLLATCTYLVMAHAMYEAGFRADDFSFELVRLNWYQRECEDPGSLTPEEMETLHKRFAEENAELVNRVQERYSAFLKNLREHMMPFEQRLQSLLVTALRAARSTR